MSACPRFPQGKLKKMLEETAESGKEHAIVQCGDGDVSEVMSGADSSINVGEGIDACDLEDGPVKIAHTHPNGVKNLSDQDRKVAAHENVDSVCVVVDGGEMKCETVETCEEDIQ